MPFAVCRLPFASLLIRRNFSLFPLILALTLIFTACGGGNGGDAAATDKKSKSIDSIEGVVKYLADTQDGTSADNPVPLTVQIDLQNTTAEESGWKQLLNAIDTAGKYVALDLSACAIPNTGFDPDSGFPFGKEFIVSLILPDVTRSIPSGTEESPAFQHFVNLADIPTGKSLTSIGDYSFYSLGLTNVTIPDSVTSIGWAAFASNQLTSVAIPDSITTIENMAFAFNQLTSVTIPNSVTSIGYMAFSNNQLTSVTIPNSVTTIEEEAFAYNQLTGSLTIPNSVTKIGDMAFLWGDELTSITIGTNVTLTKDPFFLNFFVTAYNNDDKRAGTYTRPNTNSRTWTRVSGSTNETITETSPGSTDNNSTLSAFVGTWKRAEFDNILTVNRSSITISSRTHTWELLGVSGDFYTLKRPGADEMTITIRSTNSGMVITDDTGAGQENWNGTWVKQ